MSQKTHSLPWIEIQKSHDVMTINGGGDWLAINIHLIDQKIRDIHLNGIKKCVLSFPDHAHFDISGGWIIQRLISILSENKIETSISSSQNNLEKILQQISTYKGIANPKIAFRPPMLLWLEEIGETSVRLLLETKQLVSFFGHLMIVLAGCCRHPSRIRFVSIVATLNRVGLNAIPIIATISFLIGVVLVYQGAFQLRKFGAEIYTVDLLAVSLLREIGILLTAIMVAGRSGSAFAAQLGTMKLNQEIDALQTLGLDPMEVLVVPRVIALVIALPLLAFIADIIGLAGGVIMSYLALDISFEQYTQQLIQAIKPSTFWVGIFKAPFFGFVIALVGCFEGMQVHGGATSVGKNTTKAVVEGIFLVMVLDAVFSIVFTVLDL